MDPEPKCLLTGFGDNSIDLELRFWMMTLPMESEMCEVPYSYPSGIIQ